MTEQQAPAPYASPTAPRWPPSDPAPITYERALELVMSLADFERAVHSPGHSTFHLERIGQLVERLGNPHVGIPTVHVAGTKGKGSTAAMVTSILSAAGYRTGLYTSPHLHRAVERIRVGMEPMLPEQFARLVAQVWPTVQWVSQHGGYGEVTTFEMFTAVAFLHYRQVAADFQVIEVGLGGRLDSTNVVSPEVCAITSISLDHTKTLGETIPQIAWEKAGIIKPGVPVVVAPQTDGALDVFRRVAAERHAPLFEVQTRMSWRPAGADLEGQSFHVSRHGGELGLWTPLLGVHQLENACTAIAVADTLAAKGVDVHDDDIREGLRAVRWPARLQVLSKKGPLVVVDGAHNPYSIARIVEAVRECFEFKGVVSLFGALTGHSATDMMAELARLAPQVVAVRSRHPRAAPAHVIARLARDHGLEVLFESEDVGDAITRTIETADPRSLVLGTGSLSVAAEIIEAVEGIPPEVYPGIKRPDWQSQTV